MESITSQAGPGEARIGRITTSGVTSEFPLPKAAAWPPFFQPADLLVGSDGAFWFTELIPGQSGPGTYRIGRITTSGVISEFPLPTPTASLAFQSELLVGSDGAVWFTESIPSQSGSSETRIGRITTSGVISEYSIPPQVSPGAITAGPDGALWFTAGGAHKIGRITPSGIVTEYPILTANSGPLGITTGTDGLLWFIGYGANKIGRITPSGVITEYAIPTANSRPLGITGGPDGALWFTESSANKIGRITTSGAITEYALPTANSLPWGITAGTDGALWFTQGTSCFRQSCVGGNKIGRITTNGVITEYPIPTANSSPQEITTGPDGALWFTESNANKIGRITTSGAITEYPIPTASSYPVRITAGPDGALWFTAGGANKIGRISTNGVITEYAIPTASRTRQGIPAGPGGALWFTESNANKIGRLAVPGVPPVAGRDFSLRAGSSFLSWTGGTTTGGILPLRWGSTSNWTPLLSAGGPLPSSQFSYADNGILPDEATCYLLAALGGNPPGVEQIQGLSDLLCVYTAPASGVAGTDMAIRLRQSHTAYLTWTPPPNGGQTGYRLTVHTFDGQPNLAVPLGAGVTSYDYSPVTTATCFKLETLNGVNVIGTAKQVCGLPDVASFSAGAGTGVPRTLQAAFERVGRLLGGTPLQH